MKLKDFLSEKSITNLFQEVKPVNEAPEPDDEQGGAFADLRRDLDQALSEPAAPGAERPAHPAARPLRAAGRRRHTRIPGNVARQFDRMIIQQVVNEQAIMAVGYRKFTTANLGDLTTPPYPSSASSAPVKRAIREGAYFAYENQRYTPVAIYSHPGGTQSRGLLNKVLIQRADGQYYTSSETICMKWVRAKNPSWESVLAFARGMAKVITRGVEEAEGEQHDVSQAEKRAVISVFHKIDDATSAASGMDVTEDWRDVGVPAGGSYGEVPDTHGAYKAAADHSPARDPNKEGNPWNADGGNYDGHDMPHGGPNGLEEDWKDIKSHEKGSYGEIPDTHGIYNAAADHSPARDPNKEGDAWNAGEGNYDGHDMPKGGPNGGEFEAHLDEKWNKETAPSAHKGKWAGHTVADLKKKLAALRKKKDHTAAETKKMRELNFAIRAKRASGGKWKGVTTEERFGPKELGLPVAHEKLPAQHGRKALTWPAETDETLAYPGASSPSNVYGKEIAEPNVPGKPWDADSGTYASREQMPHGGPVAEDTNHPSADEVFGVWEANCEIFGTDKHKCCAMTIEHLMKDHGMSNEQATSCLIDVLRSHGEDEMAQELASHEVAECDAEASVYTGEVGHEVWEPNDYAVPNPMHSKKMNESKEAQVKKALNELRKNAGLPLKG